MSKRDPLRPCMDMINNMLTQMVWILRYHIKFHLEIDISLNNSLLHIFFSLSCKMIHYSSLLVGN
jgi:hypothetical protein